MTKAESLQENRFGHPSSCILAGQPNALHFTTWRSVLRSTYSASERSTQSLADLSDRRITRYVRPVFAVLAEQEVGDVAVRTADIETILKDPDAAAIVSQKRQVLAVGAELKVRDVAVCAADIEAILKGADATAVVSQKRQVLAIGAELESRDVTVCATDIEAVLE